VKILHLATSISGGAGIAARRICQAQIEIDMEASLLGGQMNHKSKLLKHESLFEGTQLQQIKSPLVTYLQRQFVQKSDLLTTPVSINIVNPGDEKIQEANVVNIHAFYNFISLQAISALAKSHNVVVTLHDQRFFTGGCHYSFDCDQYETLCNKCPQIQSRTNFIALRTHSRALANQKNLERVTYIAPSKWLADLAMKSSLLRNCRVEVINNPVPSVFRTKAKPDRTNLFTIGFVSENLNNPYKGIKTLVEAINLVSRDRQVSLQLFGNGRVSGINQNVKVSYARFEDDEESAKAYSSCDVVVIPSLQDNSPSVLAESLMCGIPVIASRVGGISEILSQFGLPVFPPGDFKKLAQLIENFALTTPKFANLENAHQLFSNKIVANKYQDLYSEFVTP